ncbi:SusD/RagB family nutrient-binding outer membrane lipoprotein [Sinomicrobium kalidii]|uniref:SusD/RagB family nutrient-binding outer membrane lipoprotein n=1 Tax=Sinomicrobium kalidii TaxID=2900738 RepID=UPI001E3E86A8|nr:SusD/RagB family nutrient-binding outer membrane lipoprotein [Sinomicrobium kalidii]UGU14466.1 SusD/RagB family nutrient-binding outer membrane lipoprotein [Sinomicrobium kalidii]
MKKILYVLFSLIMITGCDKDFEELNTDPNNPVALPAHLLLGGSQRIYSNVLYGVLGGAGGDMGAVWAQTWTKVQYNDEERYVPRRGVIDNIWDTMYSDVISEANAMYSLAEAEGNANLQAISLIIQASGFQFLTELYGPIPFTEAMDPNILKPVYDNEATVYEGVIDMYTQAANMLSTGGGEVVASSDLYYGGDITKWKKLANSLKFRALMRISSTRDVSAELQALINGGQMFTSNADNAQVSYLPNQPDANPIYELIDFGARPEYKVNSALVEMMESLNDPRLEVYAAPNADGDIMGKPAGYGNQTTLPNEALGYTYANISGLGEFYLNPELPGTIMSYAQLSFLKAEAANEGYISGGTAQALVYYNEGIQASFEFNGLSASTYLAQPGIGFTTQADAREKIGQQLWLALFDQGFEAWTEWRRTKIPALEPAAEAAINQIPSRYYYPTTEVSLNKDNYDSGAQRLGGDELTSPLFWQ